MAQITYRPLTAADIPSAQALSTAVKWPHRPGDWAFLIDQGRGFAAVQEQRVIGTILAWRYESAHAALGMVIVSPQHQGQGIGRQLLNLILADLQDRTVWLTATVAGRPLYEKVGFAAVGTIHQHQAINVTAPTLDLPPGDILRPLCREDLPALGTMSMQATGWRREHLLELLLQGAQGQAVVTDGKITGFGFLRSFGRGSMIGPVVAESGGETARDQRRAQALIAALMRINQERFLRIDVHSHTTLSHWLDERGLRRVDSGVQMVRRPPRERSLQGTDPALPLARQFAICSQALG